MNTQIQNLTENTVKIQTELQILTQENIALKALVLEKNATIMTLVEEHAKTPLISTELLKVNNEMTQFLIIGAGIVAASIFTIYLLGYAMPGMLSLKKILPTTIYSGIQTYTPFLQENVKYTHHDTRSNSDWIVDITNEKIKDILVKLVDSDDFVPISTFLNKLLSDAGTLTLAQSHLTTLTAQHIISVPEQASALASLI